MLCYTAVFYNRNLRIVRKKKTWKKKKEGGKPLPAPYIYTHIYVCKSKIIIWIFTARKKIYLQTKYFLNPVLCWAKNRCHFLFCTRACIKRILKAYALSLARPSLRKPSCLRFFFFFSFFDQKTWDT